MGLMEDFLGNDYEKRTMEDFIRRYEDGSPEEGYTDEEAWNKYRQVSDRISLEDYRQAAQQAVERLSPSQRLGFAKQLKDMGATHVLPALRDADDDKLKDPAFLTSLIMEAKAQEPHYLAAVLREGADDDTAQGGANFLEKLFGKGGTGAARALLGGIAAMASKNVISRMGGAARV